MANPEVTAEPVDPDTQAFAQLPGDSIQAKIEAAVQKNKVVVFGRSTCPFCIEVTRTLFDQGVPFTYYRVDLLTGGFAPPVVHEALKGLTNQRTVPYVYVNGRLLGGCDATKASISSGEFDTLLGAGEPTATADVDLETGMNGKAAPHIKSLGIDEDSTKIVGSFFEFPNSVDNRVIRIVAFQVFVLSLLLAVLAYKKEQAWHWVAVGLLTDFCLRFYAGAGISPLGSIAMLIIGLYDLIAPRLLGRETGPIWGAGPPKQFAVSVGIFFSAAIVVFQFTHVWIAATIFAAVLCFFAGLECFLNFCAGCWVFGHAIRLGIVPDSVYIVHINTLPETKHTWYDFTKRVRPPIPVRVRHQFLDHPKPTKIDLNYKTGKTSDWELEDFHYIKHVKMGFISSVVGVAAVPALFKFMAMAPRFQTSAKIWEILTLLSLIHTTFFFVVPYVLKMIKYPRKVRSEWFHPAMNNAFAVPSMTVIVYAFLCTRTYSTAFARVLFWIGASTAFLIAAIIVGNWIATPRHPGHLNGAWQMAPVGLFIVSVVGPIVDTRYTQICYLFFGFALIMYIALFTMTFQNSAFAPNADPLPRQFAAIWMAAPAVASIAWTVLTNAETFAAMPADVIEQMNPGDLFYNMDSTAKTLFYIAVSMGVVNLWMAWRRYLWLDQFKMNAWAFGFPTVALAWAAVLYDATIQTALSKVFAVFCISVACVFGFVLIVRTYAGVSRLKVFIPEHKWGPMSHLPLAQDAMRELLQKIATAAASLAENPSNTRLMASIKDNWASFTTINTFYTTIKRDICFPQIGDFFPGHQQQAVANHEKLLDTQTKIDAMIEAGELKANAAAFASTFNSFHKQAEFTFTHMEDHIRPVMRRYVSGPVQVKILRDCWDDAPKGGWWAVFPAVINALPMQNQRLTFIRAFMWAMPERAQQFGTMVALGADPVLWYRLKHQLPEIIPRGEAGWKKY